MLLALLTPRRLEVLKTLRKKGPLSVRALAKTVERDYKNVHVDTRALEEAGLLEGQLFGIHKNGQNEILGAIEDALADD